MKHSLKNLVLSISFLLAALFATANITANTEEDTAAKKENTFLSVPENKVSFDSDLLFTAGLGGSLIQVKRYSKSIKSKPALKGGEFLIEKEDERLFIGFPKPDGSIVEREILFADSIDKIILKKPVKVASTVNVDIATGGLLILDGIQLLDKDEVLLWNQTDQTQNGVYIANAGSWTRRLDSKGQPESVESALVYVKEGSNWADTEFNQVTDSVVLGTSSIVWTPRTSANVDGGDVDLLP